MDYTRPCKKCGELFDAFNHDTYDGDEGCYEPYIICEKCNDEFWNKWYQLPKVKKLDGIWQLTEEHDILIKEYQKESDFK
jgi:hypothetical protein